MQAICTKETQKNFYKTVDGQIPALQYPS